MNLFIEKIFDKDLDVSKVKDLESAMLKQEQVDVRNSIAHIEQQMRNLDLSVHVEIKVKHYFSKGVYAREIFIPKGTYVVGKIHKFQNINILSQGDIELISIEGRVRVKAPFTVVSPPGVKRLAYAHEDCIWTTIHGTEETDLEKIEDIFIAKTYEDVVEFELKKELGE